MSVHQLNDIKSRLIMNIDEIEKIIKETTIFDKIIFSGITKERIAEKIEHLETVQVPSRNVLLDMDDKAVVEYWFKNWLHPNLKHAVSKSPSDKRGCSATTLSNDMRRDFLSFYENGQQNYSYTLDDVKAWLQE